MNTTDFFVIDILSQGYIRILRIFLTIYHMIEYNTTVFLYFLMTEHIVHCFPLIGPIIYFVTLTILQIIL